MEERLTSIGLIVLKYNISACDFYGV